MNKSGDAIRDLIKVCRKMIECLRNEIVERAERDVIITCAEETLKRAEHAMQSAAKRPTSQIFFGRLGCHYDFRIKVRSVLKSREEYFLSCYDGRGRDYTVQLDHEYVEFEIRSGFLLYFRGKVAEQRIVNDKPVTFLEVVSKVKNISPDESAFIADTIKRGKNARRKRSLQQETPAPD